jgi:hypothetical protein
MNDERAAEGLEHLQAAALELIAAARAFLDVAEDVVTDPEGVTATLASLAALVDMVTRRGGRAAAAPDEDVWPGSDEGSTRIRRIDVS